MADIGDARLFIDTLRISSRGDPGVLAGKWAAADAAALVGLAEYEGAVLWLHRRLKMLGITLAAPLRGRLSLAAKLGAAQCLRVDEETWRSLAILDAAGIPAVPLKAAAMRRISSRVPYSNACIPGDVDILCSEGDASRAWNTLREAGYAEVAPARPADHHHLPVLGGTALIGVEIHRTTVSCVRPDEAWRRARADGVTIRKEGRSIPLPGDTELLWHAMAHAMVSAEEDARFGTRLRHWLDAAALLSSETSIDWERVRERIASECSRPGLARAWFVAAAELSGRPLPAGALGRTPVQPLSLARLLAWRVAVLGRPMSTPRWNEKLLEEGARGEFLLPIKRPRESASRRARVRSAIASRMARIWWSLAAG